MKNRGLKRLLSSNKMTFFISFIVAAIMWSMVVTQVSTDIPRTIKGVPININYNQTSYKSLGLEIIETDLEKVDVVVSGPRSVVGSLTADDIVVYPNFANVDDTGKYGLPLTAAKTSSIKDFKIEDLSRNQISIRFDRLIEKQFSITMDISSLVIPGEYMVGTIYTTPEVISVKGPENTVNTIDKVIATVAQETLSQSVVLPAIIKAYDVNGAEIDETYLTMNADNITITVPVLKEVDLPIKVEFINVPQGFDTDTLHMSLSQSKIHLAVPSKTANNLNEFVAGYIDLKTLKTDTPYVFDVKVPSGYKNMKDLEKVSATVSSANLVTRTVAVSEIKLINKGEQDVEVLTQIINNVQIVGEEEVVEALSSGSVIAQIDLARVALAKGQQTVEVEIIIPSTGAAYVRGAYTATIKN
ncbi:MAG: CdaR family protein [Oscillospiraceae bacterium]